MTWAARVSSDSASSTCAKKFSSVTCTNQNSTAYMFICLAVETYCYHTLNKSNAGWDIVDEPHRLATRPAYQENKTERIASSEVKKKSFNANKLDTNNVGEL